MALRSAWAGCLLILLTSRLLPAQAEATLLGKVRDPSGAAVAAATVTVENALAGYRRQVSTAPDGTFSFRNIPCQDYVLTVEKPGFQDHIEAVSLQADSPVEVDILLTVAGVHARVTVSAMENVDLIDLQATGTRTQLNLAQIERMPLPVGTRALESALLSFPGFAANANGAIHPRGAHNQMTYVIDGMPISDQLIGAFGNGVDSSIVQVIELFTGNIPAEYGSKVSGVANISTQSGMGSQRRFFGSMEANVAQFDHAGTVAQFGGQTESLGYFASLSAQKSNRFLDQVSTENLHNAGRFPELRVYQIIEGNATITAHGSRDMPVWGLIFRQQGGSSDARVKLQLRNLTRHIESLQIR